MAATGETSKVKKTESKTEKQVNAPSEPDFDVKIIGLTLAVWASFLVFGFALENLTSTKFGGEKFKGSNMLVCVQGFISTCLAAVFLLWNHGSKVSWSAGVPLTEWLIVSLGFVGAHLFGYSALRYISYPMQVIFKSCKLIPVMGGEYIFANVRPTMRKIVEVALICVGVSMFTFFKTSGKKKSVDMDHMMYGIMLACGALVCDGVYGPYQNRIIKKYKPTSFHLMFNMNLYETIFSLMVVFYTGEVWTVTEFWQRHPQSFYLTLQVAGCLAVGTVFIFMIQRAYHSLTVTKVTTIRKLVTVMFSSFYFGHDINAKQWMGALVVFGSKIVIKMLPKS